ncbi:pentatricopeptide repeat-containing protein [Dorcoceras hygrometricum]|uniref:Pentatricopeptide repeat-containing protein n=1 Tax=Dorcoceras hygrometricum TaxID=472368 RepID=A0A2Z7CR92_9LAMI|nr:pentatricopeptide repeat-containing protein [Dorcoceras hygrometricum]
MMFKIGTDRKPPHWITEKTPHYVHTENTGHGLATTKENNRSMLTGKNRTRGWSTTGQHSEVTERLGLRRREATEGLGFHRERA